MKPAESGDPLPANTAASGAGSEEPRTTSYVQFQWATQDNVGCLSFPYMQLAYDPPWGIHGWPLPVVVTFAVSMPEPVWDGRQWRAVIITFFRFFVCVVSP